MKEGSPPFGLCEAGGGRGGEGGGVPSFGLSLFPQRLSRPEYLPSQAESERPASDAMDRYKVEKKNK